MLFRQFRQFSLLIIFLVACLQGLVPLLHAHPLDIANVNAETGIHLHEVDAKSFAQYEGYSLLAADGPDAMEVGLARQPRDVLLVLPVFALFVLIALSYPASWLASGWQQLTPHYIPSPRYFSSLLRAPPQY